MIAFCLCLLPTSSGIAGDKWHLLSPGMDLGTFTAIRQSKLGDSRITVLRVDPNLWDLEIVGISLNGGFGGRTAKQWSKLHQLTASIIAGMFGMDGKTHVGYLRYRDHLNNDNSSFAP